jgi:tetratricopeptide (TPR) repeat protein
MNDDALLIQSLDDAIAALKRKKGSFEEWLECAQIFAKHSMWSHLEEASKRALESALKRPIKPTLLIEAAKRYASGSLKVFNSKSEFESNCRKSQKELLALKEVIPIDKKRVHTYLESLNDELDEILILLADGSPEALTSIASRLRKRLGRSDLAIRVADIALHSDSSVIPAYVTRGSAHTDLGDFLHAESDFEFAEKDTKSRPYAIAGHTRLLIKQGKFVDALEKGDELLLRKVSRPIIFLMAAAAKGAGDHAAFERFLKIAESLPESTSGSGRTLLMRQAIRILIENRQFDAARELIQELATFDRPLQVKFLTTKLNKELARS